MARARRPGGTTRSNPLVGFRRQPGMSIRDQAAQHGPLLIPKAQENFQAKMEQSDRILTAKGMLPIPIYLSVGDWDDLPREAMGTLVIRTAWWKQSQVSMSKLRPGDPGRITPVTPFNVFHQLEHNINNDRVGPIEFDGEIANLPFANSWITKQILRVNRALYAALDLDSQLGENSTGSRGEREKIGFSYGICSRAAELGAFGFSGSPDGLADVFAAYCFSMNAVLSDKTLELLDTKLHSLEMDDKEAIRALKFRQLALYEMDAAFKAFTLGLFVRAYYADSAPHLERSGLPNLYLSRNTLLEIGEWGHGEAEDFRLSLRLQGVKRVIGILRAVSRFPKVVLHTSLGR